MEKIRTIKDLKGRGYRPTTVEGVGYRAKYDSEGYRPLDVQRFSETVEVIKLSRAVREHVLDILEERMLKRADGGVSGGAIGIGEGPYDAEYGSEFGLG